MRSSLRAIDPVQRLPTSVSTNAIAVKVTNEDHQDWRNVRILVNDKYACPPVDKVEQGASAEIKLAECLAADGERFQPLRTAAVGITVTAVRVDDTGDASAVFHS